MVSQVFIQVEAVPTFSVDDVLSGHYHRVPVSLIIRAGKS